MKKIITVSLVAMMAVTAAHADIASTTYVTTRTGTVSFDSGAAKGKTDLTEAIKAVDAALGTTTGNAATKTELQNAQNALQANINKKVDQTVYDAHVTAQLGVDSDQNADIKALQDSIAADGATTQAIEAAAAAAAAAQQTADGAVNVNTQQGEAITALQNTVNTLDNTYATDVQAAAAAKDATDALNADSVGVAGSFISTVSQTKGTIAAEKTAFVAEINEVSKDSTIAPQTKAVKTYVDGKITQIDDALTEQLAPITQSVTDLEGFRDGLETAATKEATANHVVTSVTTTNGKVTAVGSAQITNAMVADTAAIEKSKLHGGVQTSLGKADAAVARSQVGIAESFGISEACKQKDVICSLTVKGTGDGAVAQWEVVQP